MKTTKKEHLPLYIRFREKMDQMGKDDFLVRSFERNPISDTSLGGDRSIVFTVSSPGVKRDGHEIVQDGWRLDNYRTNPVVMWAHSRDTLPIATSAWEKLVETASGRVLRSQADFLSPEDNQFADQVLSLYKKRILNAVSAGWRALKYDFVRDEEDFVTGIRFLEQDLMEYSAVPIPADPQALQRSGVWTPDFINNLMRDAFDKSDEAPLYLDVAAEDEAALERKVIVDLGEHKDESPFPAEVRGKVDEWAKNERMEAISQRLQQGVLDVASEEIPPMKEYLASHYASKEQKAPWDTASGLVYESIHGLLKEGRGASEAELGTLRESAESLAVQLYGEERLPEPWQNPYQNCVDGEKMQRLAAALDGQLLLQIPDVMIRESTVRAMAKIVQQDFEDEIKAFGTLNTIREKIGTESYDEVCTRLDSLLTLEREVNEANNAPAPTPPAEEKPDVVVQVDTQEVRDAVERIEKLFTKSAETPLTTESELRSIFSTILSDAPVAGK